MHGSADTTPNEQSVDLTRRESVCNACICTSSIATTRTETTLIGPNSSMVTVMGTTTGQQGPQKCLNPSIWSILNNDAIHYVQWFTVCLTLFNTNVTCMHIHLHTYILSVWGSLSLTPSFFTNTNLNVLSLLWSRYVALYCIFWLPSTHCGVWFSCMNHIILHVKPNSEVG